MKNDPNGRASKRSAEEVLRLSRSGNFEAALRSLSVEHLHGGDREDALSQVFRAELLQQTGATEEAHQIAALLIKDASLERIVRSRCHSILGNYCREKGSFSDAADHFQRAAALAEEGGDNEERCWALIRLILTLADKADPQSAVTLVSTARTEVPKLGSAWVTAALHLAIAELESKRGLLRRRSTPHPARSSLTRSTDQSMARRPCFNRRGVCCIPVVRSRYGHRGGEKCAGMQCRIRTRGY